MWPSASPLSGYYERVFGAGATIARLDCALQQRTTQASKRENVLNLGK
jgi:hypothetical protein